MKQAIIRHCLNDVLRFTSTALFELTIHILSYEWTCTNERGFHNSPKENSSIFLAEKLKRRYEQGVLL